jgi:HAD superfamily hydrolase (TIGR01509 family)
VYFLLFVVLTYSFARLPFAKVILAMDSATKLLAVCFDLDGTLINSEDLYDEAGREVLRRRGKAYDRELREQVTGRPAADSVRLIIEFHSLPDTVEDLILESGALMLKMMETSLAAMPGVYELLNELDAAQIPYGVATSATREFADFALARLGIKPRFQFVLTTVDIHRGKPDPEIYLLAAERFGVAPAQMMVLDDSANGCRAADSAGAFTVAVPNRHTREHNFSNVQFVAQSLADPRIRVALGLR